MTVWIWSDAPVNNDVQFFFNTFDENDSLGSYVLRISIKSDVEILGNLISTTAAACSISGGTLLSSGYNITSNATCAAIGTDQVTDPLLEAGGPVDNGGSMLSIAPQSGSPALDIVPIASCESGDIRDDARSGSFCDSGSLEL